MSVEVQRGIIFRIYFRNGKANKADYEENGSAWAKF